MRDLFNTLAYEYGELEKEDLRRIALELIHAIYRNNTKWDYVSTMNIAIESINDFLGLENENAFVEKEI